MVGLTIARDFLYIVRSVALGDHHPVTSIEIIQLRLSSPVSNVYQNGTSRIQYREYQNGTVRSTESSIASIASNASIARDIHRNVERLSRTVTRSVNGYSLLSML